MRSPRGRGSFATARVIKGVGASGVIGMTMVKVIGMTMVRAKDLVKVKVVKLAREGVICPSRGMGH